MNEQITIALFGSANALAFVLLLVETRAWMKRRRADRPAPAATRMAAADDSASGDEDALAMLIREAEGGDAPFRRGARGEAKLREDVRRFRERAGDGRRSPVAADSGRSAGAALAAFGLYAGNE